MTTKIAVSLPDPQFKRLERKRRAKRISRSAAVQQAIEGWLKQTEHESAVRAYVEGYRKTPEDTAEADAWVTVQSWGEYDPG